MSPSPTPRLRDHRGGRKVSMALNFDKLSPKIIFRNLYSSRRLPQWLSDKENPCSSGDAGEAGLTLGQEDPLEEEMATHSSILAWKIPWLEEPGGLLSMGLQRIGHDWAIELVCPHGCVHARTHTHTNIHTYPSRSLQEFLFFYIYCFLPDFVSRL